MAGHWIEWEKGLDRKPEVIQIGRLLAIVPLHAAGCCMKVWEWVEDVTENGIVAGVTPAEVSYAVGIPGIGEAMVQAGWIILTDDGIVFTNWERHNGNPSKKRALNALRMRVNRRERRERELRAREGGTP